MMNTWRVLAALSAAVLLAGGSASAAGQTITLKDDITVSSGETQDHVFSLGGHIVVDGFVKQSVVAIGGSITVSGEVGDAVVGVGSRVILKSTAVVKGDVVALGGTLEKEPGSTIRGDTVYFQSSEIGEKIFNEGIFKGIFSLSFIPVILFVKLAIAFLWLVVALIGAGLFPKPISRAAGQIRTAFWPVFGIGLLAIVIFTGLVIFAAILSIILIGVPVLFALITAGIVIKIFGRLAVFYFFGDSLLRAFGSQRVAAMGAILLGFFIVSLIGFVPIFGFVVTSVLNIIGWGVAVRTKFGSRDNWFQKPQTAC
jgi:hypothetical protein